VRVLLGRSGLRLLLLGKGWGRRCEDAQAHQ
jgi:hypothetical protein